MLQSIIHYSLHFAFPIVLAKIFFCYNWLKGYLIMLLTMLIDLDHLLANPIFDANRCSIGFHPLHKNYFFIVYLILCYFPKTRALGLGLVLHLITDTIDCIWMKGNLDVFKSWIPFL